MVRKLRKVRLEDVSGRAPPTLGGSGHQDRQSSEQAFRYVPLRDVDEIRLLRIAPKTIRERSGAMTATVHHVHLSDSPLYTAVSWMWGPRKGLVDLEIDGTVLSIQANLGRIIRDLQDDHQARNLWVDAICIDQDSVEERNHQVQLMGRIYNHANYVVACVMAEQPTDRKRLAKTAKQVHQVFERCLKERNGTIVSPSSLLSSEYRLFFENLYFTRRWIIQELIQARSVTLCCEGYQMPMSTLESMFDDSRQEKVSRPSGAMKVLMDSRAMQLCRLRREMDENSFPLETLLYTHETAECADFRDQVYALLSLSEHAKERLPVRYDIDRFELMLSVIMVSHNYENLSPFRTLSFTCFLKQHLGVKTSEVLYAKLNPPVSTRDVTFNLQGVIRGTVTTHRVSPETGEAAIRARDEIPPLNVLDKIYLEFLRPFDLDQIAPLVIVDRQPTRLSESNAPIAVPGIDQCLFAFEGDDSRRSPMQYRERAIIAGLASRKVEIGDEIWQFERTPLAIIARRSPTGYTLFGRAYLLREISTGHHSDRPVSYSSRRGRLEDDLVWVKDAKLHDRPTPIINVDIPGLFQLMTWATYDAKVKATSHSTAII